MTGLGIVRRIQAWTFERRLHAREFADGSVLIRTEDGKQILTAQLLDRSPDGFRIAYTGARLTTGERLLLMGPFADFHARVVWSKRDAEREEAGLQVWPAAASGRKH